MRDKMLVEREGYIPNPRFAEAMTLGLDMDRAGRSFEPLRREEDELLLDAPLDTVSLVSDDVLMLVCRDSQVDLPYPWAFHVVFGLVPYARIETGRLSDHQRPCWACEATGWSRQDYDAPRLGRGVACSSDDSTGPCSRCAGEGHVEVPFVGWAIYHKAGPEDGLGALALLRHFLGKGAV